MIALARKLYHYFLLEPHVGGELLLKKLAPTLSDKIYLSVLFRLRMGYWMDWQHPRTFSEKIQWLKLYDRNEEYVSMVDKYEAKSFVSERVGNEYVIPTLGVWSNVDEIDFNTLPDRFVLKTTHDCGGVVLCDRNLSFKEKDVRSFLKTHLKRNYFLYNREWPYKNVKPRVIAEQYIGSEADELIDYKFFCFHGVPKLCQVISGRNSKMTVDFYDMEWIHQDFREPLEYDRADHLYEKPSHFQEMIRLAEQLSHGFAFLRVDMYESDDRIFCGELTFFPTSGLGGFSPRLYDELLGSWITLSRQKTNE